MQSDINMKLSVKKKIILPFLYIFAVTLSIIVLNGCNDHKKAAMRNTGEKITVITTIFASYDFVRQITGGRVNVALLLPPGSESHSYEPPPKDIIAIQNCDVFIFIGGETDKWVNRILDSLNTEKIKILAMLETVSAVPEEITEGMEKDDDDDTAYDEHVWTSPGNAKTIVRAITELLCKTDPGNAGFYRQNEFVYLEALAELDSVFKDIVAGAKRKTIVFGDRFPFRYFADAYKLQYFAAFPGCSAETEPSAATVAFLINKIKSEQIPVVFHTELSNERMAETISRETGARKLPLHSCHSVIKRDFEAGISYLDLMYRNAENLREALY